MLKTLRNLLTLKPYGNQLIDGMAELWLVLAPLNIVSIALCDAVAWGYFGYTTAHGAASYLTAAVAGVIVFVLVASVDAMFVMHDRSQPPPTDEDPAPAVKAHARLWRWLARNVARDHVAIGARVILVILTFTVTAPFLTQLFFARDIEANINRHNEQRIAAKRQQIIEGFDRQIATSRSLLAARQRDLEKEIAGRGTSGRYGMGPTALAMQREIGELQTQVASAQSAKTAELQFLDAALASPELLASRYGIDLIRQGPDTRARVIAELEKSASFRATRRTIKAFLVFMFLGLVALKLFQPESVRIYYSARLQAAYTRLMAGVFNHRLDPRELPAAGGMTPVRFADWYENDQHSRDLTDRLRDQTALAVERLKTQEEAVRLLQETLRCDMNRMQEELAAAANTTEDLETRMLASRQELSVLNAKIAEEQQQLDDFRYDVGEELSLRDQQLLINSRNRTMRHLADHRAAAATLAASVTRLEHRLETNRLYESQLRQSLATAGSETASLSRALQKARERRLIEILDAS